jgi:lipopolysaccharide transport system permease protein
MRPDETAKLFDGEHMTVIEPSRGWRMLDWRELWAYRELLWVLAARDVKVRYQQAVLGAAWAFIRPFTTMVILSLIFGHLARMPSEGSPYPIFLFAALVPWNFFASALTACSMSLLGSSQLVSKVYFPRVLIPAASIGAPLADLGVSVGILLAMMLWYGVGWSWQLLAVPVLMIGVAFAALGIGLLLAALTAAYRDFAHLTPFLVQIWMYATPVVFPLSIVPQPWRSLLLVNPMTGFMEGLRAAFLDKPFDWFAIGCSFALAGAAFAAGLAYFARVERRFADII